MARRRIPPSTTRSSRTRRGTSIRRSSSSRSPRSLRYRSASPPRSSAASCSRSSALTLWVLEIRDVRCYAASVLWVPAVSGVLLGNVSIPLAFARRGRLALSGRHVAAGVGARPRGLGQAAHVADVRLDDRDEAFAGERVWRWRIGALVTLTAWAVIGFDGLDRAIRIFSNACRRSSPSAATRSSGWPRRSAFADAAGRALTLLVGGALLVGCVVYSRRADDERAFTCAVAATLALSPIVWLHYLVVLLVPVAIARPRFSPSGFCRCFCG